MVGPNTPIPVAIPGFPNMWSVGKKAIMVPTAQVARDMYLEVLSNTDPMDAIEHKAQEWGVPVDGEGMLGIMKQKYQGFMN